MARVEPRPGVALADGFQFQDVNADGLLDLVRVGRKPEGVFERNDGQWMPFRPFLSAPGINWADPNLRLVDLDGDGFPDVLTADHDVFRWHRALGRDGFADELRIAKPLDHLGPVPLFATEREAVLLADMTGDGLSDLVRVRNGEVCYWPNLGYGRFGPKVTMDRRAALRHAEATSIRAACGSPTSTAPAPPISSTSAPTAYTSASTRSGNAWSRAAAADRVSRPRDTLQRRAGDRPARHRHRLPGLVLAAARRRGRRRCATST